MYGKIIDQHTAAAAAVAAAASDQPGRQRPGTAGPARHFVLFFSHCGIDFWFFFNILLYNHKKQ